jgi:bacteriorhodopsin
MGERFAGPHVGRPKEIEMITFILLAVFAIIGIAFFVVAYTANQRKRAGQSGMSEVHHQQVTRPRAVPPGL